MPADPDRSRPSGVSCDIVFVCQAGEIEKQAILLAQSIRLFGGTLATAHLHAIIPIPEEIYGIVDPGTLTFLESLQVRFYRYRNPTSDSYKVGNKLNAFNIDAQTDTILWLDTDTLVLNDFSDLLVDRRVDFRARAAGIQWPFAFSKKSGERTWEGLYAEFGLKMPTRRIVSVETNRQMVPYFNAGVILCSSHARLSELWIRVARRLMEMKVPHLYPWLDQIALPVALSLGDLSWDTLPEEYNFGPANWLFKRKFHWIFGRWGRFNVPPTLSNVKILHYHMYRILKEAGEKDPELRAKVQRLLDTVPFERAMLAIPTARSISRRISVMWGGRKHGGG
jgi:hypothetical protein